MKLLALAWKDLRRQYRSGLLLLMAIGVPLLLTTLLYFAFGSSPSGPTLQVSRVLLVDLDDPPALSPVDAGAVIAQALRAPDLADLLEVTDAPDAADARERVRSGDAAAAVIVPAGASAALLGGADGATIEVVTDPSRPLGGGVVRDVVQAVADGLSSSALAARVTTEVAAAHGRPGAALLALRAATDTATNRQAASDAVRVRSPEGGSGASFVQRMVAEVMASMMIFFVFFSGAYGASAVLREQEEGTLKRLAGTPTSTSTRLTGRFLGIAAILLVQIAALVAISAVLFGIRWGRPLPLVLAGLGLAVIAAGFGVLLLAFVRTSRQSGPVFGVVLTVTGMVGGLMTATMPSVPPGFRTAALFTPQGWAMELWRACMAGGGVSTLLPSLGGTLAIGIGLLALGVPLMRRRFANGA